MGFWERLHTRFWRWLEALLTPSDGRAKAEAKTTVSIRVIRADGTVEDLGVVSRGGKPAPRK